MTNSADVDVTSNSWALNAHLTAIEVYQRELFPLTTRIEFLGDWGTADASGWVEASDCQSYLIKSDDKACGAIRASEWVGSQLAELLNIPCPRSKIIKLSTGELCFGSRKLVGIADGIETAHILTSDSAKTGIAGLTPLLSSIFAYDMFIKNVDRHDWNYVSVDDAGTRRFYAIDFGRSLFWHDSFDGFPSQFQQTRATFSRIRALHGFDLQAALSILDRLSTLSLTAISSILAQMPESWLDQVRQREFLNWWQGGQRQERLSNLRKGLRDGSLL